MWFAEPFRAAALALVLAAPLALGGCTLTPVYGEAAVAGEALALSYAEPQTRLEQVLYQTLSARLGRAETGAPEFSATVGTSATRIGLSSVPGPVSDRQVVATVTFSVVRDGAVLASGRRSATAGYQTTGQIVADQAALTGAEEQATRAAAETVRLALIAALAGQ